MRPLTALLSVKNLLRAVTWDRRAQDLDLQDPRVALLHSALTASATADELSGEDGAVALFRTSSARHSSAARRLWRPAVLSTLLTTKLAAAVAVGAVGLGGAATVAYTGSLPDTLQNAAHDTIGAPAAHPASPSAKPRATPTATPVGPDATGSAAYGLCTAFDKVRTHGKADEKSIAYRNLATAAGATATDDAATTAVKVTAYCATVAKPGSTPSPTESSSPGHGKPSSHPTGKPATLPTHHDNTSNPSSTHRP